jgi:hypothetical protein
VVRANIGLEVRSQKSAKPYDSQWAIEQAFASYKFEVWGRQSDAAPGLHAIEPAHKSSLFPTFCRRRARKTVPSAPISAKYSTRRSVPGSNAPYIVPIVELAAIAGKLTNNWRQVESAFVQVQRVDTPLMRVRIV